MICKSNDHVYGKMANAKREVFEVRKGNVFEYDRNFHIYYIERQVSSLMSNVRMLEVNLHVNVTFGLFKTE